MSSPPSFPSAPSFCSSASTVSEVATPPLEPDLGALGQILTHQFGGDLVSCTLLARGCTNHCYLYTVKGGMYDELLARIPTRVLDVREFHYYVITATFLLVEAKLPAPKLYCLEISTDNPARCQYSVMQKMEGVMLTEDRFKQLNSEQQGRMAAAVAGFSLRLLKTPIPTSGPYAQMRDLRNSILDHLRYVLQREERILQSEREYLQYLATGDPTDLEKGKDARKDVREAQNRCDHLASFITIVHSCQRASAGTDGEIAYCGHWDAHRGNFLFNPVTLEMTGVIDLDVAGKVSGSYLPLLHSRRLLRRLDTDVAKAAYWSHFPQTPLHAALLEVFAECLDSPSVRTRDDLLGHLTRTEIGVAKRVLAEFDPRLEYKGRVWDDSERHVKIRYASVAPVVFGTLQWSFDFEPASLPPPPQAAVVGGSEPVIEHPPLAPESSEMEQPPPASEGSEPAMEQPPPAPEPRGNFFQRWVGMFSLEDAAPILPVPIFF